MPDRIDPASDRPVYKQMADHLRDAIVHGRLGAGERLPSESELVAQYDVSRVTARRALGLLVGEGLVTSERGRGWFVRSHPPVRRLSGDRFARRHEGKAAFTVDMEAGARSFKVDVLFVGPVVVPDEVAPRLGVQRGTQVVTRRRRYLVEGRSVEMASSYIPMDIAEGTKIMQADTGPGGIYARMEDEGFVFQRYDEDVSARLPTEEEVRLLGLPSGSPVLHISRSAIANDRVVEVCETVMDAAAFVLSYSLPAVTPVTP